MWTGLIPPSSVNAATIGHEDHDARDRLDEIADDRKQDNERKHDLVRIVAGDVRDPPGDHDRAAQIGEHPAKGRGGADRDQGQRVDQPSLREVARQLTQMLEIEQRDDDQKDIDDGDDPGFTRREPPRHDPTHRMIGMISAMPRLWSPRRKFQNDERGRRNPTGPKK